MSEYIEYAIKIGLFLLAVRAWFTLSAVSGYVEMRRQDMEREFNAKINRLTR